MANWCANNWKFSFNTYHLWCLEIGQRHGIHRGEFKLFFFSNAFINYNAFSCVQLVPESDAVKFFETIDMDKIYKKNGLIEGFFNRPVIITGKFE